MNILIVGNVLKDVYLSIDSRTENLETDKNGTKWLDLSFDASTHNYFHRISSFGGSAVSLEVFHNFGLDAAIINSDFTFDESRQNPLASAYRYILTSEDSVSYIVPTTPAETVFEAPSVIPDYLFIDRSAEINEETSKKIQKFLAENPSVRLILYLKNNQNPNLNQLITHSALIFAEQNSTNISTEFSTSNTTVLPYEKTVYVSDHDLTYKNITEPISVERIDKLTHLSAYSIATATILASFIKKYTVEDSLKLARLNVENSNLDSTLTFNELSSLLSNKDESLDLIAATLMADKKGILAADESGGSIKKKFAQLNIEDTFENRHDYRNIFFTTDGIENCLSGVILFDETARDHMDTGESIPDFLISRRIIPGIKVDQGLEPLENSPDETYTKGLDDLKARLREYYQMGLRFAKWRAAFNLVLDENGNIKTPTDYAITENCHILAEYAKDCQSAGIVPIVEPELVYDGDYTIEQNATTTGKILETLVKELKSFKVNLKACIIKCNMVLAGKKKEHQSTPEEVGKFTAETLKNHVPPEIAGIVFLSGGQTPEQATDNLREIIKNGPFPWPLTFSFARALQDPALFTWQGNNENTEKARQAFLDRLIQNTKVL